MARGRDGQKRFLLGRRTAARYRITCEAHSTHRHGHGIGAAGTVVFGMLFLNEPVNAGKVICVCLIISGVVGLHLFGGAH